ALGDQPREVLRELVGGVRLVLTVEADRCPVLLDVDGDALGSHWVLSVVSSSPRPASCVAPFSLPLNGRGGAVDTVARCCSSSPRHRKSSAGRTAPRRSSAGSARSRRRRARLLRWPSAGPTRCCTSGSPAA